VLTALSLYTEGFYVSQGFHLPFDRFITIKGNVRDLTGYPVPEVEVTVTVYKPPHFNVHDLVAIDTVMVKTDQEGEISSNPINQLRILKSTNGDALTIRLQIQKAGAEWLLRIPAHVNLILLKDLVAAYTVTDPRL